MHMPGCNGHKIFVHASGPKSADGTGVLIVHGFPGSSWNWKGIVAIVGKEARVVVPDMLGFGHSAKPKVGCHPQKLCLYDLHHRGDPAAKICKVQDPALIPLAAKRPRRHPRPAVAHRRKYQE